MNDVYDKGLAVGVPQIRKDTIYFRYRDETFEFPTIQVLPNVAHFNGCYYEAKVSKLRKLKKESSHG